MGNLKFILNRYKYFLISLLVLFFIFLINKNLSIKVFKISKSSMFQMLAVLPPIMLLLGLMDVWVSRESMIKFMGENSGIMGIVLSILIASFAAGPMYAAFPFTAVLLKKGVKFSNVIIFMNAWCVVKLSTLLFEIGALGYKFTMIRLFIDIPGVIIMGYLVDYFVNKKNPTKFVLQDNK
ncbi:permease [Romboutsia maritimum]|uniref:Permease n=1 Tax=Romboutsia maritimum TaxID=2020948 RepID=A0A371ISQ6_9FIRM|nr:permease [Romboutsia maritimum]RDY23517.1 permease [Romboutsia maritimum]